MRAAILLLVSLLRRSFGALRGGPVLSEEHLLVCTPVQMEDGSIAPRTAGTPQRGHITAWHFF